MSTQAADLNEKKGVIAQGVPESIIDTPRRGRPRKESPTERVFEGLSESLLREDMPPAIEGAEEGFPKRYYNAGAGSPQVKVHVGGGRFLVPVAYSYLIANAEDERKLLNSLRGRVWEEDYPEDAPDFVCQHRGCNCRLRSTRAVNDHMRRCHPTHS